MNERKRVCESVCVCCSQRKSQYCSVRLLWETVGEERSFGDSGIEAMLNCSVRLLWETVGEEGSFGDSGIEAMLPDEATLNSMPK